MRRPMLAATTPGLPVHMVVLAVLFTDWTRGSLAILAPTSTHRFPEPLLAASVDKTPAAARHPRIHRHHCPRPRLRGAAGCIARGPERPAPQRLRHDGAAGQRAAGHLAQIGKASCRERECPLA